MVFVCVLTYFFFLWVVLIWSDSRVNKKRRRRELWLQQYPYLSGVCSKFFLSENHSMVGDQPEVQETVGLSLKSADWWRVQSENSKARATSGITIKGVDSASFIFLSVKYFSHILVRQIVYMRKIRPKNYKCLSRRYAYGNFVNQDDEQFVSLNFSNYLSSFPPSIIWLLDPSFIHLILHPF